MNVTTEQLFSDARTQSGYLAEPVSDDTLRQLYDLLKWGPTAFNSSPARLVFVRSAEAKAKLLACVSPGNVAKIEQAPVTVIVGMDMDFPRHLPTLFPAYDAKGFFDNTPTAVQPTAFRNASLQGAYLIMAARALGLDCGPMSGFDAGKLDQAFWAGTAVQSNFICTLGKGDPAKLFPRNPRLAFEEACQLA